MPDDMHAPPSPGAVAYWLGWVAERLASAEGDDPLLRAAGAIRTLLNLLDRPDRSEAMQADAANVRAALAATVRAALIAAEPTIAAAAAPLTPDHVAAGLAQVRVMLTIFGWDLSERVEPAVFSELEIAIHHTALIADELDAVLRRRLIAAHELSRPQSAAPVPSAHTMH